jgi:hypothetical protein
MLMQLFHCGNNYVVNSNTLIVSHTRIMERINDNQTREKIELLKII